MSGSGWSRGFFAVVALLFALVLTWRLLSSGQAVDGAEQDEAIAGASTQSRARAGTERVPLPKAGEDTRDAVAVRALRAGMGVLRCSVPIQEAAGVVAAAQRLDRNGAPMPTGVIFDSELVLPVLQGSMATTSAWVPGVGTLRLEWDATKVPLAADCERDARPAALVEGLVDEFDEDTRVVGCGVILRVDQDGRFSGFVSAPAHCELVVEGLRDGLMFESEPTRVEVRAGERIEVVLVERVGRVPTDDERDQADEE